MRAHRPLLMLALAACPDPERPVLSDIVVGSCTYTNRFSDGRECKDYLGTWSVEDAEADCTRQRSTFVPDQACDVAEYLGQCLVDDEEGAQQRLYVLGDDPTSCGASKTGCEFFGGGYWEPSSVCTGVDDGLVVLQNVFPQPVQVCSDPLPGEPEGQSEDGQVCTWEIISGATEEGRRYNDYASCDPVRRQRGYAPVPYDERYDQPDPRMEDPEYAAEVEWVRSQLQSAACVCCHDASAPDGPSVFDIDAPGNFTNQLTDRGAAMGAGWINTVSFGAYPPEQNNGFSRADLEHPDASIFMSTDMPRMLAFWTNEMAHRGRTKEDFANEGYVAGPLDTLRAYEPSGCGPEEGVAADGTIRWAPGRARYVYVLEADATSPTVPPNLDTPAGTMWRIDLPADGSPIENGKVKYGQVPAGWSQRFPADGSAPTPLVSGRSYYLYATADVLYPLSRCIFTAP